MCLGILERGTGFVLFRGEFCGFGVVVYFIFSLGWVYFLVNFLVVV